MSGLYFYKKGPQIRLNVTRGILKAGPNQHYSLEKRNLPSLRRTLHILVSAQKQTLVRPAHLPRIVSDSSAQTLLKLRASGLNDINHKYLSKQEMGLIVLSGIMNLLVYLVLGSAATIRNSTNGNAEPSTSYSAEKDETHPSLFYHIFEDDRNFGHVPVFALSFCETRPSSIRSPSVLGLLPASEDSGLGNFITNGP